MSGSRGAALERLLASTREVLNRLERAGTLPARVIGTEIAGGGVLNLVVRVALDDGQQLFAKVYPDEPLTATGAALGGSGREAYLAERDALTRVRSPDVDVMFPSVLAADSGVQLLLLTNAGSGGAAVSPSAITPRAGGRVVAAVHRATTDLRPLRGTRSSDRAAYERWVRLRTTDLAAGEDFAVATELRRLHRQAVEHREPCLVHMDICPKNLVDAGDGRIGVIDFELAVTEGDPAFDVGFLAGHLLLGRTTADPDALIGALWNSYALAMEGRACAGGRERTFRYAGATLLYRVSGRSRWPGVSPSDATRLANIGRGLVLNAQASI